MSWLGFLTRAHPVPPRSTPQAPPSPNHAPPQVYMLFLLNGDVYSTAVWVTLYS